MAARLTRRQTKMSCNAAVAQPANELTIAGCLETILSNVTCPTGDTASADGEETASFPQREYDYACDKLGITPAQAEIFAAILELSVSGEATTENVAHKLGCSNLHLISLRQEIEELMKRRFVRCNTKSFSGVNYTVPDEAIKHIQKNEAPNGDDIRGLSTSGIIRRMHYLFREFGRDRIGLDTLDNEIHDLISYNPEDAFVKEYERRGLSEMEFCEQLLFFFMVCRRCTYQELSFGWDDFGRLFSDMFIEDYMNVGIQRGTLLLMKKGIIENCNNDGVVDTSRVCFVEEAINSFLVQMPSAPSPISSCRNVIGHCAINERALFYNDDEGKQVEELTNLLMPENYAKVVGRLKEKGVRSGFGCLFHGKPGTGKTESVYQIARKTGRDIFFVDVSAIRSKWVGESEKNIREVFREYRRIVKSSEVAPILLFNEADAIIGVRKKGAEDSVDKMNNSIQNIILQEMESLNGIMIATTNLTENLDAAFERRFLVKIHFQKPGSSVREHIWESLVEGIEETSAKALAEDYEFSGGQIENISRKATMSYILNGVQPNLDRLRELCENETLSTKKKDRTKIGF